MEYLTLQDIPHRHCNPSHSHRMASQSSERPMGNPVAAVCEYSDLPALLLDVPTLFLPPVFLLPRYDYVCPTHSLQHRGAHRDLFRTSLESDMSPAIPKHICGTLYSTRSSKQQHDYSSGHNADTKTKQQNHLQRSSPPYQPGEQNFPGKLPSFDEVGLSHITRLFGSLTVCSSCKPLLRGHHHTHHLEGMNPRRTLHACVHSSTM
jgi:hypothetical protein